MRWWDRPLSPVGRAALLIVFGALAVALAYTAPADSEWVIRGAEWLSLRNFGFALIAYGLVRLVIASLRVTRA